MSLYSVEATVDSSGQFRLFEVGGIGSKLAGFRQVHGDDRVEQQVYGMLREAHGAIGLDDGSYVRARAKAEHPILARAALARWWLQDHLLKRRSKLPEILCTERAITGWLHESLPPIDATPPPFPIFTGPPTTALNFFNSLREAYPTVNPRVAEEATRNKFYQDELLRQSEIADVVPEFTPVGMGVTDTKRLEHLLGTHPHFVLKPLHGYAGLGVQRLSAEQVAERFRHSRGAVGYGSGLNRLLTASGKRQLTYVEDLVAARDFIFEYGVAVLQPFIDSPLNTDGQHALIRGVVCNGKFVDAYLVRSAEFPVFALRGTAFTAFKDDGSFAPFCEQTIRALEAQCARYEPAQMPRALWDAYFDRRGRTTPEQRRLENSIMLLSTVEMLGAHLQTFGPASMAGRVKI